MATNGALSLDDAIETSEVVDARTVDLELFSVASTRVGATR